MNYSLLIYIVEVVVNALLLFQVVIILIHQVHHAGDVVVLLPFVLSLELLQLLDQF